MRLPDNSSDRLKIMLIMALGFIGALYGIYAGVLHPLRARRDATAQAIEILEDNLRKAEISVGRADRNLRENAELTAALVEASRRHLLQPRLGNYMLGARERFETYVREAGARIVTLEEVGLVTLPRGGNDNPQRAVQAYVTRAVIEAGYEQLLRILQQLGQGNPYLCTSAFQIAIQPDQPARHIITLEIQWPIWADPAMTDLLVEQAGKARDHLAEGAGEQGAGS